MKEEFNNFKKENRTSQEETKVDYLYGDLSNVDTKKLRSGLAAYKNFKRFHDNEENADKAAETIIRIEGELLKRKEVIMEDIPEEDKVLQEVEN